MNTSYNDEVDCICSQDGGRSSRAVTRALWGSMFVQRHNPSRLRRPSKRNKWRLYERPLKGRDLPISFRVNEPAILKKRTRKERLTES